MFWEYVRSATKQIILRPINESSLPKRENFFLSKGKILYFFFFIPFQSPRKKKHKKIGKSSKKTLKISIAYIHTNNIGIISYDYAMLNLL